MFLRVLIVLAGGLKVDDDKTVIVGGPEGGDGRGEHVRGSVVLLHLVLLGKCYITAEEGGTMAYRTLTIV